MRTLLTVPRLLLASLIIGCAVDSAASPAPPTFKLAALGANNQLVLFKSDAPQQTNTVSITGTDAPLTGIDVRPVDKQLYGLSEKNGLFIIDPITGSASKVSKLTSPFRGGTTSGFDFNPQSDRLRIVASTGQNLRVKVTGGAVGIDAPLTYASNDLHSGRRPAVTAAAYTNSIPAARTTVLYVIDYELDTLIQQEPPNDGVLTTIGRLGIDCTAAAGFDIATDERGVNHAFLVCRSELFQLDIKTGAAQSLGKIAAAPGEFISLAVLSE